ncbi:MAG: IS110 family transposase [Gammaproteobacteria bacterium]|nr:IS110 family transposase [Gammaproteobacteria bacterium]
MKISVYAVDLAKSKFQVHGFDALGERRLAKTLSRSGMQRLFAAQDARGEVVMEACGSAHYWGRYLEGLGYRVRLIAAQHVKPFVVGNKTDANDADAIYAASRRADLRAVPLKSTAQQDALLVHATRERLVKARTALVNQLRGELGERGVVFGKQTEVLRRGVMAFLEQAADGEVTEYLRHWVRERLDEWRSLDERIKTCEREMQHGYRTSPACVQIGAVEGVGVITATATVATVGNARQYASGRQFAAWLGLTPKERSSGQARQLSGITKRGDSYLRKLFVHGARAAVLAAQRKSDARSRWINALVERRGHNKAVVALANKNARIVWALLSRGESYRASVEAA